MPEVVDDRDRADCRADNVEAACNAGKACQRLDRSLYRHASARRAGNRRQRIGEVVPSGHVQRQRVLTVIVAVDDQCRLSQGTFGNAAGHDPDLRHFLLDAEGDYFVGAREQRQRLCVIGIDCSDTAAFKVISEELAQLVHTLVVEADVEQHADSRAIERNRAVAFIDFAEIKRITAHHGTGIGPIWCDEVLHHGAVHYRRLAPRAGKDPAKHGGDSRLAASPCNSDPGTAGIEEYGIQFCSGETQAAEVRGSLDLRYGVFNSSRSDKDLVAGNDPAAILRMQLEALPLECAEFFWRMALVARTVGSGDLAAATFKDLRQRQHA